MSQIIHADVFFFIASVATVVLALAAFVVLVYIVIILRDIREIVGTARSFSRFVRRFRLRKRDVYADD